MWEAGRLKLLQVGLGYDLNQNEQGQVDKRHVSS